MREVFSSMDTSAVNLRRTLLEDAGIATFVRNEDLSSLTSQLIGFFHPALCVVNDRDFAQAMVILRTLGTGDADGEVWQCPVCNESVPGTFAVCWKCETPRTEDFPPQPDSLPL
ncbi:MAG: hypothetical protein JWO94_1348 [Verrucomicrobiaceae bacterium]|nr:hypothetical protein [Verrucomicrobiaceae bacterium]